MVVAVHYYGSMIAGVGEKLFPNPAEIRCCLVFKGYAGPDRCMHEKIVSDLDLILEGSKEADMLGRYTFLHEFGQLIGLRKNLCARQAIALKGL